MKNWNSVITFFLLPLVIAVFTSCGIVSSGFKAAGIDNGLSSEYLLKSLTVNAPSLYVEGNPESSKLNLKHSFASSEWSNELDVPFTIDNITVTAEMSQVWSSMSIGGEALVNRKASSPISLAPGQNDVRIKVIAQNGKELEYIINVTRHTNEYEIATLAALTVSGVSNFSPAFDLINAPGNREFTASSTAAFISIDAAAAGVSDGAKVEIRINDDLANDPAQIPLEGGLNTITILSTAGNGSVETYTIRITKPIESDSVRLADLSLNGVALTPVFNPETASYSVTVNASYNPFKLNVQPESSTGSVAVTLTAGGNTTDVADLNNVVFVSGSNLIEATVSNTKYGAATKVYSVEVNCIAPSSDATLKSLKVKMGNENRVIYPGTFQRGDSSYHSPSNTSFNKAKTDYVTVIYGYSSITVTAVSTESLPKDIQFVTTRYFGTVNAVSTQSVIASQQLSGNTGTAVINLDQGYVTRIDVVSLAPDNVTQIVYSLYAKLLNADEYHWGIYTPSFDKSKSTWTTPSGISDTTYSGSVSGTSRWVTGLSNNTFQGGSYGAKSQIILTNFNDGINGISYNEGGLIVSGEQFTYLKSSTNKSGFNVSPGRYYIRTAGGTEIVDYSYHLLVAESLPVEHAAGVTDPLLQSYTDMKYMGAAAWHRQYFKNTKPYPFAANNWFEPWSDGQ